MGMTKNKNNIKMRCFFQLGQLITISKVREINRCLEHDVSIIRAILLLINWSAFSALKAMNTR